MENWLVLLIGRLLLLGAIIRIHVIFKDLHDVRYDRCFNFLIPNSNPTQVYREVIFQARGQFWLDKKPVWLDKNTNQYEEIEFQREWSI